MHLLVKQKFEKKNSIATTNARTNCVCIVIVCMYLCSIQMCLSQHHCVNNPGDDLISLISLTNDRGCPMCQQQSPSQCPQGHSLSPMSNYEHDINVIKKPSSELTSAPGSIYFLFLRLGSCQSDLELIRTLQQIFINL